MRTSTVSVGLVLVLSAGLATQVPRQAAAVEQATAPRHVGPLEAYWGDVFGRALDHVAVGYAYAIHRGGEPVAVGAHGFARAPRAAGDPGGADDDPHTNANRQL